MRTKVLDTYYAGKDGENGKVEICINYKDEIFYLQYYDNVGHKFFTEEFPNKSLRYVEDAAENWCLGIKKLDEAL